MLAYVLAWVIGLGSLGLYLVAFFLPEIHRKNDFVWSGLGLFYALILWVYAQRMTGGILLGQTASVTLLSWFGWETLKLRRQVTPSEQQTKLPNSTSLQAQANSMQQKLTKQSERVAGLFTKAKNRIQATPSAASKDKSTQTAQPSQTQTPAVAVRDTETLEKDRLEVSPQPVNEAIAQDQPSVETAPIPEKVKPEVEVSPQSSGDATVAKPDQASPVEVPPDAKGVEPKIEPTKVPKDVQVKAGANNLQTKLTELQAKLADVPVRESWDKFSKQVTSLFTNVKDRVQGIIGTVKQQRKPEVETTQPPATPTTPTDSPTPVVDSEQNQAEETAAAIAMDEAITGSTPVEDVELKVADEETTLLTSEATTGSETTTELEQPESTNVIEEEVVTETESVPEADSVATVTPTDAGHTPAAEETTISDQSAKGGEVEAPAPDEELASEVEVAAETETDWPPESESDWPPEPEPDWSNEPDPPVTMEAAPPEAASVEPEAPPSTPDSESPSEDKAQK